MYIMQKAIFKGGETMSDKTEKNLALAFAAESKAAARNAAFAQKAEKDGYAQIARLFRAVSDAESIHARRYLIRLKCNDCEQFIRN